VMLRSITKLTVLLTIVEAGIILAEDTLHLHQAVDILLLGEAAVVTIRGEDITVGTDSHRQMCTCQEVTAETTTSVQGFRSAAGVDSEVEVEDSVQIQSQSLANFPEKKKNTTT